MSSFFQTVSQLGCKVEGWRADWPVNQELCSPAQLPSGIAVHAGTVLIVLQQMPRKRHPGQISWFVFWMIHRKWMNRFLDPGGYWKSSPNPQFLFVVYTYFTCLWWIKTANVWWTALLWVSVTHCQSCCWCISGQPLRTLKGHLSRWTVHYLLHCTTNFFLFVKLHSDLKLYLII